MYIDIFESVQCSKSRDNLSRRDIDLHFWWMYVRLYIDLINNADLDFTRAICRRKN